MTKERWDEVRQRIEESFPVSDKGQLDEEHDHQEWIEFQMSDGKRMKLTWHDRPRKVGEKAIASKRIGAHAIIEAEYSKDEHSQFLTLEIWNDASGSWEESDAGQFAR
jgi:hypothetical protein